MNAHRAVGAALALIGVLAGLGAARAETLDLDPAVDSIRLTGYLDVAVDPSGTWTLADARAAPFEHAGPEVHARPPGGPDVWMRARVHNPTATPVDRLLVLRTRLIDRVVFYAELPDGRLVSGSAGEDTALADRPVDHPLPMLPLTVPPGQTVTIWLHLADTGALGAPLILTTWPWLDRVETRRNLVHGLFMGSVAILMIFALFLAIIHRSRLYGWFSAYLGAELFLSLTYFWGGGGDLLPPDVRPEFINRSIVVGAVNMFWMSAGFATRLMDLDRNAPRLFAVLRHMHWAYALAAVAAALLPYETAVMLSAASFLPVLLPLGASIALARRNRIAALYNVSWAVLGLAVAAVYLRLVQIIPVDFPTAYFIYIGFVLQFSVLVAAMGRRVVEIERERRRALENELAAYQRNAALSRSFERFVPKAFLDRLERTSITEIELGHAVSKNMTVLFSDIRSFTTLVEHMSPEENFAFINEYLGFMEPAIHQHLGFIDKYIGDAVMALFDDEAEDSGGAEMAVQAAIGMHEALARYNTLRVERGDAPVDIGIGLHTGALMLGTIGGRDRLNASVIGDSVNLASRIEGLTKRYGAATLLTGATLAALPTGEYTVRQVDRVRVKGKTEAVDVYQLFDSESAEVRARLLDTAEAFSAARTLLVDGDVEGALAGFRAVLKRDPADIAARVNIATCERLQTAGLPADWDGAVKLDSK